MALVFDCSKCGIVLRVGEEHAGKQVRCGGCSGVNVAPVPKVEEAPEAVVLGEAAEEQVTATPGPKAAPARRERPEDGRPRRRGRDRERDEPRPSSSVLLLGLGAAALLLFVGVVGAGAWFVLRARPVAPPPPPVAVANPPRFDDPRPVPPPFPEPDDFPGGGGPPPVFEERKQPFVPAPVVPAAIVDGKFETNATFDAIQGEPPNRRYEREYRFGVTAGKVYWVRLGEEGERFGLNCALAVEGPDGPVAAPDERRFGRRDVPEVAIDAAKAGAYTVRVSSFARNASCKLSVRELRPGEALPAHLQFAPADLALPKLAQLQKLNIYDKQFSSAAFAPDGKSFYISQADGTFAYYTDPRDTPKGSYKTTGSAYALCVDRKGRVYGQLGTKQGHGFRDPRRAEDLGVWDKLQPAGSAGPMPAPDRKIPMAGIVSRTELSPDGKWVYYLDTHNRKLGRIDTEKQAIDKEIDSISGNTKSFCVTRDGKRLYAISTANQLYVIDAAKFEIEKTVTLDRGNPSDVAATDAGQVYLVLPGQGFRKGGGLVDLRAGVPERAAVTELPIHHCSEVVRMMPDQKSVLFSADRHLQFCSVPARPGIDRVSLGDAYNWDYYRPGYTVVSPDGRTLLFELGVIFSVSR